MLVCTSRGRAATRQHLQPDNVGGAAVSRSRKEPDTPLSTRSRGRSRRDVFVARFRPSEICRKQTISFSLASCHTLAVVSASRLFRSRLSHILQSFSSYCREVRRFLSCVCCAVVSVSIGCQSSLAAHRFWLTTKQTRFLPTSTSGCGVFLHLVLRLTTLNGRPIIERLSHATVYQRA